MIFAGKNSTGSEQISAEFQIAPNSRIHSEGKTTNSQFSEKEKDCCLPQKLQSYVNS